MMYSPIKYINPRYSYRKMRYSTYAQKKNRQPHLSRRYRAVWSTTACQRRTEKRQFASNFPVHPVQSTTSILCQLLYVLLPLTNQNMCILLPSPVNKILLIRPTPNLSPQYPQIYLLLSKTSKLQGKATNDKMKQSHGGPSAAEVGGLRRVDGSLQQMLIGENKSQFDFLQAQELAILWVVDLPQTAEFVLLHLLLQLLQFVIFDLHVSGQFDDSIQPLPPDFLALSAVLLSQAIFAVRVVPFLLYFKDILATGAAEKKTVCRQAFDKFVWISTGTCTTFCRLPFEISDRCSAVHIIRCKILRVGPGETDPGYRLVRKVTERSARLTG